MINVFLKIFPVLWTISIIPIPILNSSFLRIYFPQNFSYFDEYWIFFALLGIFFITVGIVFVNKANKAYKAKALDENGSELITSGVFRIIRHPKSSAWVMIFLGAAIISDSIVPLILSPMFLLILEVNSIIKENLILIPKFSKNYEQYKKKTPYRIIPTPLNFLLIIIVFIITYVGVLNFI